MSGPFSSVNGLPIVSGRLMIPAIGPWTADVSLMGGATLSGAVTVAIGNLTLQGTVYRSSAYGGQTQARIVAGGGGWRTTTTPQGYGSAGGVALAAVLGDAATAVGETINVTGSATVGNGFARGDGLASLLLDQAVAFGWIAGWRIDVAGVTQTTPWPAGTISTPFTPTEHRPDHGRVTIATEDYASWMPGTSFSHPLLDQTYTSGGVEYEWDPDGKFRFQVLTDPVAADRFVGPLRVFVQSETAGTKFYGRYEYSISNPTTTTVDLAPTDPEIGLPEIQNVPLLASSIASYTPPSGGLAHLQFVNGSPARPVCVWTEADASVGPVGVTLCPQSANAPAVARVGDTVVIVFPPAMQISGLEGLPIPTTPFVGLLTCTTPGIGTIQTGSSLAACGG